MSYTEFDAIDVYKRQSLTTWTSIGRRWAESGVPIK